MRAFVENECLLPSLAIGISEEVFWKQTPRTLAIYFKAYNLKQEREFKRWSQQSWEIGLRVKQALDTSVLAVGLWDGKHKPSEYPKCPYIEIENNPSEMTEEQIKAERLRAYNFLKSLGKHK